MFTLASEAFTSQSTIPRQYTGEGEDLSPPLQWQNAPQATKEFALICDDPDAPTSEPWVHWVIYKLPATLTSLPQGIARTERLSDLGPTLQGKNSWNTVGYRGPLPPPGHGEHRYFFRLYALSSELTLKPSATKKELLTALQGTVLQETVLLGKYKR